MTLDELIERVERATEPDREGDGEMRYRLGTAPRRDYDAIYRRLHPRQFPFSAFERQLELHDLWPSEQQKFRDMVDTVLDNAGDTSNRQSSRP